MVKTHTVVSQCAVSGRRLGNYREYSSPEIVSVMEACGPLVSCRQPERICCANGLGYIQSTSSTAAMCSVIYLAMISIQVVQTAYHVWTDVCVRCYSPPKRTCSNHLSSLSSDLPSNPSNEWRSFTSDAHATMWFRKPPLWIGAKTFVFNLAFSITAEPLLLYSLTQ